MKTKFAEGIGKFIGGAKRKIFAVVPVLIMVLFATISGTVAWLVSEPDPVINTFTYGFVDISLEESDTALDGDGDEYTNMYKMIPGESVEKDPVVNGKQGRECCWVFITLDKSDNFDDYLSFELAKDDYGIDIWTALESVPGVYFTIVRADVTAESDHSLRIFADGRLTVRSSVTRQMLDALGSYEGAEPYPVVTVGAVSVQLEGFEPQTSDEGVAPDDSQLQQAAARAWNETVG